MLVLPCRECGLPGRAAGPAGHDAQHRRPPQQQQSRRRLVRAWQCAPADGCTATLQDWICRRRPTSLRPYVRQWWLQAASSRRHRHAQRAQAATLERETLAVPFQQEAGRGVGFYTGQDGFMYCDSMRVEDARELVRPRRPCL